MPKTKQNDQSFIETTCWRKHIIYENENVFLCTQFDSFADHIYKLSDSQVSWDKVPDIIIESGIEYNKRLKEKSEQSIPAQIHYRITLKLQRSSCKSESLM